MKKKRKTWQRIVACLAALVMVFGMIPMDFVSVGAEGEESTTAKTYVLETKDLTAFDKGAKKDEDSETAGTDSYFTVIYSSSSSVGSSTKKFEDGYESSRRINFGGGAKTTKNSIKFTTSNEATVKIWWAAGGDSRQMAILDSDGTKVVGTEGTTVKDTAYISTLKLSSAGTYYLGGDGNNNYIFKVEVTEEDGSVEKAPRAAWSGVDAPSITGVALNTDSNGKIDVTVSGNVGYDGADKVTVTMTDSNGTEVTASSSKETTEHTVTFTPTASGTYKFSVKAVRENETDKEGAETKEFTFTLPLKAPSINSATNKGSGSVEVKWNAVTEAESYLVTVDGTEIKETTSDLSATITGLTAGNTYTVKVQAVRGDEKSDAGSIDVTIKEEAETEWAFSAYGTGVNTKNNGYTGNANDGSVTVYSEGGKGKIVPGSTDGLAFYYTTIDPDTQNFTLTADIHVDSWTLSNGQEGFGLMAADTIGVNGSSDTVWNNSYQAIATKIEYYYADGAVTTDDTAAKISMKLGIGTLVRTGVTKSAVAAIKAGTITSPKNFVSDSTTLETSCGASGAGTYNIIGNSTATVPGTTNAMTDFKLSIQRNNTGYIMRLYSSTGDLIGEKLYYDLERTALTQLDSEHIYVGFFASRYARMTATNITLTTIDPDEDEAAQEREIELVAPSYKVNSAETANSKDYNLIFRSNADGTLSVSKGGTVVYTDSNVKASTNVSIPTVLSDGDNTFSITFTPNADYAPGAYKKLSSYDSVTFDHTVSYKSYGEEGATLYVSPNGSSAGSGTKDNPIDIYTAVQYAKAGQTIYLMEGTYNLTKTVTVDRGIDGTADKLITMMADPEATSRPKLDFGGNCAGMILAGNYWHFKGFDVTNSANAQKGIQVSGSHNTLELIETYKNGNTGLQISRYLGSDSKENWPSYNLILNCTSYENADAGYEDADGFAAKLTVGDGNVFDGCIAHHNADDGWDLYAKVQNGSIGKVVIQNCVAYKNGYITGSDGKEINAGNGNGFKMGGESMSGYHELRNSIAFMNKSKGIDSNSCPDNQVYNSVSFNNESYNVALYTNNAVNTDYKAVGIISYRTENMSVTENIKPKGTQDTTKIYGTTNYYWDTASQTSVNTAGTAVSADWFESLTFTSIDRNEDGSINTHGFLVLTEKGKAAIATTGNTGGTDNSAGSGSDNSSNTENSSGSDNSSNTGNTNDSDSSSNEGSSSDDTGSGTTGSGSSGSGSTSGTGSTSGAGSTSTTPVSDILTSDEIPGASVVQIDGVDFAQIGSVSQSTSDIMAAIDANGQITTNDTVIQTTTEISDTVLNKLSDESVKEVAVFASQNASVAADVVNKLVETGKTLSIGVVDSNGKVSAIVTLDGSRLTTAGTSFDLKITVDAQSASVSKLASNYGLSMNNYSVVDFSYSGSLPGTFKVAVDVSDRFANGTQLALYYNNEAAGRLENQYQVTTVSGGFAEFAIGHCSEYVLVDVSAAQSVITTNTLSSPKTADTNHVIFWLMMMAVAAAAYFGFEAVNADKK